MDSLYVTTTIPYVNARPHVGFALELVQADALARYHRLAGMRIRLQSGTDENARKNVESARAAGVSPRDFVAGHSQAFRELGPLLDIQLDEFVQTAQARHARAVSALWQALRPDDLYRQAWEGRYCSGCEDFLGDRDLVDGLCPDHRKAPVPVREENWFFRLSAWQAPIEEALASGRLRITPEKRREEILAFVRRGLVDISVSRSAARSDGWGIPVPGDPDQVVYVWIDALVNYLTGLGYPDQAGWAAWWSPASRVVHVLGKNVWKFHAIYWPALLLSAGLPLPDELVIHGFLTVDGQKIGKSLGNAIDPAVPVSRYGVDAVRYYLLRSVALGADGDFSGRRLEAAYSQDLANNLGNLTNRLLVLCQRSGWQPSLEGGTREGPRDSAAVHCPVVHPAAPEGFHQAMAEGGFDRALGLLWEVFDSLNREIEQSRPWETLETPDNGLTGPEGRLAGWTGRLLAAVHWLEPFLPATTGKIRQAFAALPARSGAILFPRLPPLA